MESIYHSSGKESIEILRNKLRTKCRELHSDKLKSAAVVAEEIGKQKKIKTVVRLLGEANKPIPCWKTLEDGFTVKWEEQSMTPLKRDFVLLSHLSHAVNKRNNQNNSANTPNKSTSNSPSANASSNSKKHPSVVKLPPVDSKAQIFKLPTPIHVSGSGQKFVLRIFKS